MATIKSINFAHVGRNDGCLCDRCGQYLTNIWTVKYADGVQVNFGIDCFEKMAKESRLSTYGEKLLKKALKSIERHQTMYEKEKTLTEETDIAYQNAQVVYEWSSPDYWQGKPWAEWHEWRLTKFWPIRFEEDQKEIAKFSRVNFAR